MKSDIGDSSMKKSNPSLTHSGRLKRKSTQRQPKGKGTIYFGENNPDLTKNKHLPDNTITTTKYNLFTFTPKSLLYQFRRSANIYFLVVSILTCMSFSPKQPSSMIGTFTFVLLCTMVKEAIEDYNRYKQDRQSNSKIVQKHVNGQWKEVKCSNLRPGDIVKIVKDEEFSADTLIFKSSNDTGYCYIDTKNLDGETNLKEKCALEEFKDIPERNYAQIKGALECEKPDENLTSWEGVVVFQDNSIYASLKNLILKGCSLKNTDFAIGIVVYSGHHTKIMKNSKRPKQKVSRVMRTMNTLLYSLFALDIVFCVIFACFNFNFVRTNGPNYDYIYPTYDPNSVSNSTIVLFGFAFLTFFVAYSQIIPISLYVALEIVKIFQGVLVFYDAELYDVELKKPATARTTDLIEELGQVEFIFSDKTGTLTQNSMVLKKCFVNNKVYGLIQSEKEDARFTINGDVTAFNKMQGSHSGSNVGIGGQGVISANAQDKQKLEDFFYLLSLCHSVFPEKTDKGIIYQGSSPDDIALVKGAQQLGIEFANKDFSDLTVVNHITKETLKYEIKCEMPFDSERKRMSVVVQEKSGGKRLILLSKGADNVMLGNTGKGKQIVSKFLHDKEQENVNQILTSFSKEGLRILVMGMKFLDVKVYNEWERRHNEIRNKGQSLSEIYAEMEHSLSFVGISAIEDKLQDGVPETINHLLRCGIRIWVLTGDKQDTALEIAKSCQLIDETMHVLDLSTDLDSVEERLKDVGEQLGVENFEDANMVIDLDKISNFVKEMTDQDLSIIIDGATLEVVLGDPELARLFFLISVAAKSVVCCRVSPKQKSKVVQLANRNGNWVTLSIGDGANDVPMIMEANIGVGIQGKEGTQAVRSADYAIGQFRHLEKLLLVYGRNGYVKITKFICYYFYKNIICVFTELFLAFFDGYSGQIFFADYLSTMYNAFFTSWPCLFTFSLEKELDLNTCKKFPVLYKAGPKNYYFNFKTFWSYICYAIIHSSVAFFAPTVGLYNQIGESGATFNNWMLSSISFTCVVHIVSIKLMLISEFWNFLNLFAVLLSIAIYYAALFVLSSDSLSKHLQPEMTGVASDIMTNFKSLVMLVLTPLLALLPDIIFKQLEYNSFPTPPLMLKRFFNSPELKRIMLTDPSDMKRRGSSLQIDGGIGGGLANHGNGFGTTVVPGVSTIIPQVNEEGKRLFDKFDRKMSNNNSKIDNKLDQSENSRIPLKEQTGSLFKDYDNAMNANIQHQNTQNVINNDYEYEKQHKNNSSTKSLKGKEGGKSEANNRNNNEKKTIKLHAFKSQTVIDNLLNDNENDMRNEDPNVIGEDDLVNQGNQGNKLSRVVSKL